MSVEDIEISKQFEILFDERELLEKEFRIIKQMERLEEYAKENEESKDRNKKLKKKFGLPVEGYITSVADLKRKKASNKI